jgi:hypothetical protein
MSLGVLLMFYSYFQFPIPSFIPSQVSTHLASNAINSPLGTDHSPSAAGDDDDDDGDILKMAARGYPSALDSPFTFAFASVSETCINKSFLLLF